MSPKAPRSGALLEQLWVRFCGAHAADFPGAKPLSKREASAWLMADTHALARWTNDAAHQSKHPEWRIPLRRVPEVCHVLKASDDERDELMFARLQEIQESEEKSDVMVLMHWLTPTIVDLAERPVLAADERQVLEAYRRARDAVPGADSVPTPLELDEELESGLKGWLFNAVDAYLKELRSDRVDDAGAGVPQLSERALKVLDGIAKRRTTKPRRVPSKVEMQQVVGQFRRAMRAAR